MKMMPLQRRTLALFAVIIPLAVLLVYVAVRSGPLAPVAVEESEVKSETIHPALFGIGTVEARYVYAIGPTAAGRLKRLEVQVGDRVKAGQIVGEMDPVDLDDRISSQDAVLKRTVAAMEEAAVRQRYADTQAKRYEQLLAARTTSDEILLTKRQEQQVAEAALAVAREDLARARADAKALQAQRNNLRLIAPADGVVSLRAVDPGTTVVAGQAVVQVIDPRSLWLNVRFDQASTAGLGAGLKARVVLRSRDGQPLPGRVLRVEPIADAVTEEILAKVVFDSVPAPLPPIGELAEVTVDLPPLASSPVIPNAAVHRQGNAIGVWRIANGKPEFIQVQLGRSDLDGRVQVVKGLSLGDRVVTYSEKALGPNSRIRIVDHISGTSR